MPAPKKRPAAKTTERLVYQFKVTLLGARPPIWRRILVPDGALDDLHEHIQTAMGWTNSHLHQFEIRGRIYGDPEVLDDGFGDFEFVDSLETKLSDLVGGKRRLKKFTYTYDFGDGWEHTIKVERIDAAESDKIYPRLIDATGRCPPEDVGGPPGLRGVPRSNRRPTARATRRNARMARRRFRSQCPRDPRQAVGTKTPGKTQEGN